MSKRLKIITLVCLSLLTHAVNGAIVDNVVRIKEISSSGKTLYLDKGSLGDIQNNDYGVLVKRVKSTNSKFKDTYKPVANLRAIKVFENYSVWVIFKTFDKDEVVKDQNLLLFSESRLLEGKTDLKMKRTKLVTGKNHRKEIKDFLLEGDELAKVDKKYDVIEKPHDKEKHFDVAVDLIDVDQWDVEEGRAFSQGIYRSPYAKDFSQRKRVHAFEKMVVAHLNKLNDTNINYKDLYNLKSNNKPGLGMVDTIVGSYKDQMERVEKDRADREREYVQHIKNKGDAWSKEYTDSELSHMIENLSLVKERERRLRIVAFKYTYQMYASAGLNLLNNENTNDVTTTEDTKYDVEFGYEYFAFRDSNRLKKFSLQVSGRRAQDAYFGGTLNIAQTEYSLAGHLNWYPFYDPTTIEANIIYVGLLLRYGIGIASNYGTGENGNYQLYTFPGVRVGIKYNFRSGIGIKLTGSYEDIQAERTIKDFDDGTLPNRSFYQEAKFSLGISKYF